MFTEAQLKAALHKGSIGRREQALLCLAAQPTSVSEVKSIRATASRMGVRGVKQWNISHTLHKMDGLVLHSGAGWELTEAGRAEAARLAGLGLAPAAASLLRTMVPRIASSDVRAFVEEAIGCAESRHHRAAVVLSWLGAVGILYDHVVQHALPAFNAEASRRDAKWKPAKSSDDLARMKEFDFLQVLEAISIIGKSVKSELEACLKLRNGCGHPNSLKLADSRVDAHLEILLLNVYSRFA